MEGGETMQDFFTLSRGRERRPSWRLQWKRGTCIFKGDFSGVFTVEAAPSVDSTNLVLKRQAAELSPWHVAVSGSQTAGRGRLGRSFYSPPDTGLYMSLFLRPDMPAAEASKITSAAAVAVCEAIEQGKPFTDAEILFNKYHIASS